MIKLTRADFKVPALLIAFSLVPMLGGVARLKSLSDGVPAAPDDARFFAAPVLVVVHIVAASVYALLGAFQFSTAIRLRWRGWHRRAGVLLLGCALLTGATGIWMTVALAIPSSLQGPLLYCVRLVVGVAMLASVIMGWLSIVRRDLTQHEAWMIRAYALGQGAGTQALLFLPLMMLLGGPVLGLSRDVLMSAAWAINLVVAEWLIRRRGRGYEPARSRTTELAAATKGS
ncbi:MAG TPA: DUF2306 domain-containing protein [Polyangiaceae bacterium]|nr:DUF2306 domain-containing protein [Polyangiaceae bacterium]